MSKVKNVTTEHYLAETPENNEEPDFKRLAAGILTVGDDSDEETEEFAYYDGDGTPETEVLSVKRNYPVEGHFIESDPAQQIIESKEFSTGDDRKVVYKQIRSDGKVLIAPATITDVVVTGGDADEYRPIGCTISWDRKPEITPGGNDGGGGGVEG